MKKTAGLLLVTLVLFSAASCKTTQKDISDQFQEVYDAYRADIILAGATSYTVAPGDTLSRIANAKYGAGNGYFFPLIMLASSRTVLDPDLIEPGMSLTIPVLQTNLDNPVSRGRIKQFLKDVAAIYDGKGDERSISIRDHLLTQSNSL
ncbi:MAG: LysM peptidoglycan-binding domain-containing protein [Spirochaetaceae bacterium]|jgi:hypothetical protein|nr:LysM peptidoglycan-binding domain-containing protein [Spirochaetaceae bacterium]